MKVHVYEIDIICQIFKFFLEQWFPTSFFYKSFFRFGYRYKFVPYKYCASAKVNFRDIMRKLLCVS